MIMINHSMEAYQPTSITMMNHKSSENHGLELF